ncbi:MAG: SpoIIE family protein phosphatase [Nonomuraea sp.]|nr:SpoIIE family protein phosphatase [Nonomuraea sp.]
MPVFTNDALNVRICHDSLRGNRDVNADALTVAECGSRLAIAVADGAGDNDGAAECARIAALLASAITAATGNPLRGLDETAPFLTERADAAAIPLTARTTATILAITPDHLTLAWAGDSPAWAITRDGQVRGLTDPSCHPCLTPCNVTEPHEGATYSPHWASLDRGEVARLILASDGLTAHLARPARADHVQAMTDTLAPNRIPSPPPRRRPGRPARPDP